MVLGIEDERLDFRSLVTPQMVERRRRQEAGGSGSASGSSGKDLSTSKTTRKSARKTTMALSRRPLDVQSGASAGGESESESESESRRGLESIPMAASLKAARSVAAASSTVGQATVGRPSEPRGKQSLWREPSVLRAGTHTQPNGGWPAAGASKHDVARSQAQPKPAGWRLRQSQPADGAASASPQRGAAGPSSSALPLAGKGVAKGAIALAAGAAASAAHPSTAPAAPSPLIRQPHFFWSAMGALCGS